MVSRHGAVLAKGRLPGRSSAVDSNTLCIDRVDPNILYTPNPIPTKRHGELVSAPPPWTAGRVTGPCRPHTVTESKGSPPLPTHPPPLYDALAIFLPPPQRDLAVVLLAPWRRCANACLQASQIRTREPRAPSGRTPGPAPAPAPSSTASPPAPPHTHPARPGPPTAHTHIERTPGHIDPFSLPPLLRAPSRPRASQAPAPARGKGRVFAAFEFCGDLWQGPCLRRLRDTRPLRRASTRPTRAPLGRASTRPTRDRYAAHPLARHETARPRIHSPDTRPLRRASTRPTRDR